MIKTHVSCVIDAPVKRVWDAIRPFDSLAAWHPYVAACTIEEGGPKDQLGIIRRIEMQDDGGVVRETLLALSDHDHRIVYDIIDSPMPVQNYVAQIDLHEVTEGGKTFAHWSVECDTPEDNQDAMIEQLQDIFRTGLLNLSQQLT